LVYEKPEGGSTHCVKPDGHVSWNHEDTFGRETQRDFGIRDMDWEIRNAAYKLLMRTGIESHEAFNALNALQYAGFTLVRE
jgi:hypothetical protein